MTFVLPRVLTGKKKAASLKNGRERLDLDATLILGYIFHGLSIAMTWCWRVAVCCCKRRSRNAPSWSRPTLSTGRMPRTSFWPQGPSSTPPPLRSQNPPHQRLNSLRFQHSLRWNRQIQRSTHNRFEHRHWHPQELPAFSTLFFLANTLITTLSSHHLLIHTPARTRSFSFLFSY